MPETIDRTNPEYARFFAGLVAHRQARPWPSRLCTECRAPVQRLHRTAIPPLGRLRFEWTASAFWTLVSVAPKQLASLVTT